MSYVKITGTNIGNCLTGFGIHFPITVFNSGNAQVSYSIENSNDTNFSISKSSFVVNPDSFDLFDIFYRPTITNSIADEITDLTIQSTSVEDGSVDPSGDITLNITGKRILNITGGNPRSFRVISNVNPPAYNFYWKPPTGITGDNLHNYFITGYTLQISTDSSFSSPVAYSKQIGITENTNQNPKFSTYYGFGDDDIKNVVTQDDFTALARETNYYARIHTYFNNNSGVSIYASGVESLSDPVSSEVFIGYSGTPINIKIEKQAFDFYITPDNSFFISTYNLYSKIVEANLGSDNFTGYSGINVYLPENSIFQSIDTSKGAINLSGIFQNFSGVGGTFVNFYIPSTTQILGAMGNGTNINKPFGDKNVTEGDFFVGTTSETSFSAFENQIGYNDSSNGGPAITLKIESEIKDVVGVRKDIKYNLYSQLSNPQKVNINNNLSSAIASGGGGGKAGLVYTYNTSADKYFFIDKLVANVSSKYFAGINGSMPKNYYLDPINNTKFLRWRVGLYSTAGNASLGGTQGVSQMGLYVVSVNPSGYGEMGSATLLIDSYKDSKFIKPTNYITNRKVYRGLFIDGIVTPFSDYVLYYPINTIRTNRLPGKIADTYSESDLKFSLYNNVLPSTPVFRFKNSGINSNGLSWISDATISTYTLSSTSGGTYNANYQSLGYETINLKNSQFLELNFGSANVSCVDFDLFFVCSFDDIGIAYTAFNSANGKFSYLYSSLFDWFNTASTTNFTKNQFNTFENDPLIYNRYLKENLLFNYKNACLQNKTDVDVSMGSNAKSQQISKQLYSLLSISSVNTTTNVITTTTNHNLIAGDAIGFVGDSLPSPISLYDISTPYTKQIYYVKDVPAANTFTISSYVGGTAISLTGLSLSTIIHKVSSASLYRPFILQIRRVQNQYFYFINRNQVNFSTVSATELPLLINNLNQTTLKLINRGAIGINYFDCSFYNRVLSDQELNTAYSFFVNDYFSLFAGENGVSNLNLKSSSLYSYRLPNIFSVAGTV